jgi:hypothetical protein
VVVSLNHSRREFLKSMPGVASAAWAASARLSAWELPFHQRLSFLGAAIPNPGAPPVRFPISKSQTDLINGVGYMHTDINIFASGQLMATTHTWSTNDVEGFHGSVAVAILDQNRGLLWTSRTETFGVDGKLVPFGHHDRSDAWHDAIPTQVLAEARYIAIRQKWNPKPGAPEDIAKALQALGHDVGRELNSILQEIETVEKDLSNPTVSYTDTRGYSYVETSDGWKQMCTAFPCFSALEWPDYASTAFKTTINNRPVVIQLWKGNCEKFLGLTKFPGGIGAEVGVYRLIPGKARPRNLAFLPPSFAASLLGPIGKLSDNDLWWAYPELGTQIQFSLVNPNNGEIFFSTGTEKTYWLNRWMNPESYEKYKRTEGKGKTPPSWHEVNYRLHYSINGVSYQAW